MLTAAMKLKEAAPWKKSYDQPRQHIKKQRYYFADKGLSSQSYCFSSSHVWMSELDTPKATLQQQQQQQMGLDTMILVFEC